MKKLRVCNTYDPFRFLTILLMVLKFAGLGANMQYIEIFNKMLPELKEYANTEKEPCNHYRKDQLVAVKLATNMENDELNFWFRGVVLEDSDVKANQSTTKVRMRLLDVGTIVERPLNDVVKLPKRFCHTPPMVN